MILLQMRALMVLNKYADTGGLENEGWGMEDMKGNGV